MKVRTLLLTMLALAACDKTISPDELPGNGGNGNGDSVISRPGEPEMRTIWVRAGEPESRTTLDGNTNKILWDNGDQFVLVNDGEACLKIHIDGPDQALGVQAANNDKPMLKYSSVNVTIAGKDVTSEVIESAENVNIEGDNEYKIGMLNRSSGKRFPAPGIAIPIELKSKTEWFTTTRGATIIMSSGSSDYGKNKTAEITYKGLQYSANDGSSWTNVTPSTTLVQGSKYYSGRSDTKYEWQTFEDINMTLDDEAGKPYGNFAGRTAWTTTINANTRAIYPTSAIKGMSNGTLTLTLPATQNYAEGTFDHAANIMVGDVDEVEADVYDAHFKNMMGVLELSLKGDCSVESIVVTDKSGKQLCGTATIASADFANGISVDNVSGGSSSITLNCGGVMLSQSEVTKFYIVVPAGAFQGGMDIKVNAADGTSDSFGTSKNNTIARSIIKHMPAVAIDPVVVHNIENEVLTTYLDKTPYSNWGASTYFSGNLASNCVDQDHPASYKVSWTGSASSYEVTLTDLIKGAPVFENRAVGTTSYSFENMIPGHKYEYSVKAGGQKIAGGKFLTEGRVRMVNIEDSWNYRDLGGWTGLNGRKVKYDHIFRGGSLNGYWGRGTASNYTVVDQTNPANYVFSAKSRQQMEDMGINAELDLRTTRAEESNDRSTDYSHAWSLGQSNTGIADYNYMQIKTSGAQGSPLTDDAVVRDVEWIIDQVLAGRKVAFHCKSGADRTGCVAFTIYALLGVSLGDIAFEFEITNFSHEQKVVKGRSEIRGKYTNKVGEAFYTKGFTTLTGSTTQEQAYYYLNQYFGSKGGTTISASKLDSFISYMLGE